jgi:methylamine dehydrogenase accessory protein MauD
MDILVISNIALWGAFIIMVIVNLALARQIGVLYERIAPAGALMLNKNLRVGAAAPQLTVQDLDGKLLEIGGPDADGRSMLLFFISPDCPVCGSLVPVVKSAAKSESSWLQVILASDGEDQDHKGYISDKVLEAYPYVVSELLGKTYGVSKLPYAVLIDEKGLIASMGIINSREQLESLFEAKEKKVASIQDYMKNRHGSVHYQESNES